METDEREVVQEVEDRLAVRDQIDQLEKDAHTVTEMNALQEANLQLREHMLPEIVHRGVRMLIGHQEVKVQEKHARMETDHLLQEEGLNVQGVMLCGPTETLVIV